MNGNRSIVYREFVGVIPVAKTLRNELRPVGHTQGKNLPAAGQQVADKPADLLFHRVRVHFFFFLGVAAGAFGTGPGTVPGRVAPRQII